MPKFHGSVTIVMTGLFRADDIADILAAPEDHIVDVTYETISDSSDFEEVDE